MRLLSLFLTLLLSIACTQDKMKQERSIFKNAIVWNSDNPDKPYQAFVVEDNKFIFVGGNEDVDAYLTSDSKIVDLNGKMVLPGFIDSHVHFLTGGYRLSEVQLRDAKTKEEFVKRIKEYANSLAKGSWITGGDWDHENWGGELPDREWIDAVSPDHPVFVTRLDGHMSLANSKALEIANVDNSVKDVAGGEIVRDNGRITGVFKDNAESYIRRHIPNPSEEQNIKAFKAAMNYVNSQGVTSVVDMAGFTSLNTLRKMEKNNALTVRVYSHVPLSQWEQLNQLVLADGYGNDWQRIGGLKGFMDGSLGSHTAVFFDAYLDNPDDKGIFVEDLEVIKTRVTEADKNNLQISIHAIGDKAISDLLDIYQEVEKENGIKDRRYRIEHLQHMAEKDYERLAKLNVIGSMQPYHAIDDGRWAEKLIGDRINHTYAFNTLLNHKVKLAFGSDWFVAPPVPMMALYAAVTRRTLDEKNPDGWVPQEKISLADAINAHTIHAAYASFEENKKGSITKGKLADFVILDKNLLEINPIEIRDVSILSTYVDGKEVYSKRGDK